MRGLDDHRERGNAPAMRVVLFAFVIVSSGVGCSRSVGSREACAAADAAIPDASVPITPRCPGQCDEAAARTVVYDASGNLPLYAGQALLLQTCAGSGSYCHATDASDRFGAPGEMNFDLIPLTSAEEEGRRETLALTHTLVFEQRDAIWGQLVAGVMPPGEVGREHVDADFGYVLDPLAPETDVVLAQLDTAEGREILRNWLACGAPIVEQTYLSLPLSCTVDRDCLSGRCDGDECDAVGDVQPPIGREP